MNSSAESVAVTPYELLGDAGLRRLVDRFYDIMDQDPVMQPLRAMHAPDLGPMRERLADFLSGWLGGPQRYFNRPDAKCMGSAHAAFDIGERESTQWMQCMERALVDTAVDEQLRSLMLPALQRMASAFTRR